MMDGNPGTSEKFTVTSTIKVFGDTEDSQMSPVRDTQEDYTPIVMYTLPESSDDDDAAQDDKEARSASKSNPVVLDDDAGSELKTDECFHDVIDCELRKCKCIKDKEKEMDMVDLTVDSDAEEPISGSQENIGTVSDIADQPCKLEISTGKIEEVPRAVCENATKNIDDVDMLECGQSRKVDCCADKKRKYANSEGRKKKMLQVVSENAEKDIDDANLLSFSAKKKLDLAEGCEIATQNSEVKRTNDLGPSSLSHSAPVRGFNIQKTIQEVLASEHDGDNKGCDFIETAKNRGMSFPRPRWWLPEGPPETFNR